jgi:ElaA protein
MVFNAKKFSELTATEIYEILRVRCAVFAVEQNIVCQDMDRIDYRSTHFTLSDDNGEIAGYLRAFYGKDEGTVVIGRVLTTSHGNGHGRILMEKSLEYVIREMSPKRLYLHSQVHAIGFYEKFGFKVCSEQFMEEGILHVEMERFLEG